MLCGSNEKKNFATLDLFFSSTCIVTSSYVKDTVKSMALLSENSVAFHNDMAKFD